MFGLPENTCFGRIVPKNKFYQNLDIDSKTVRSFTQQIVSVRWINKLSADTLNVEKGSRVEEVEVMLIRLKTKELDINVLRQMDRQLHYHLIFILESEERFQIWTSYKEESTKAAFRVTNYYHTDWLTEESFSFKIAGLNMDTIYENLVRQIMEAGGEKGNADETVSLKEAVEIAEKRKALEKQIEHIKTKIRKEKQFNRQVELNQQLKMLIKKLEES